MRSFTVFVAALSLLILWVGCSIENPADSRVNQGPVTSSVLTSAIGTGGFDLEVKYDSIGSYPGGGGVYLIRLIPEVTLNGDVQLTVDASNVLGAELRTPVLSAQSPIGELTIEPKCRAPKELQYFITVTAANKSMQRTVELEVNTVPWLHLTPEWGWWTKATFDSWLTTAHPELGDMSAMDWKMYFTYPGIVGAEHWTFLNEDWEYRTCQAVLPAPRDYSLMWLRPRGEWDGILAAKREWDEVAQEYVIYEIPVEDYPTKGGY